MDTMNSHVEMVCSGQVDVYLPPHDIVLIAAATGLGNVSKMKQVTVGGSSSIATMCLISTFPLLYNITDEPLKKYIHEDRGKKGSKGQLVKWGPNVTEVEDTMIKIIVKSALALLYYVVRRPQQNPNSRINKRFNTLHATLFPGIQPPTIDLDPALDFREAAIWLGAECLDVKMLNVLLFTENKDLPDPTAQAFVAQLKLFASFAEMTPYVTMKALINEGLSEVILLKPVSGDAAKFLTAEKELQGQYSIEKFPYLKVLNLPGHNRISPASYPDLLKAATARERKLDGTFKDYCSPKESKATLTDQEVEDALSEPPFKKSDLRQLDYLSLQAIYGVTPDGVLSSRKKAVTSPVDQFALLVEGLNKISADTLVSRSNQELAKNQSSSAQ